MNYGSIEPRWPWGHCVTDRCYRRGVEIMSHIYPMQLARVRLARNETGDIEYRRGPRMVERAVRKYPRLA